MSAHFCDLFYDFARICACVHVGRLISLREASSRTSKLYPKPLSRPLAAENQAYVFLHRYRLFFEGCDRHRGVPFPLHKSCHSGGLHCMRQWGYRTKPRLQWPPFTIEVVAATRTGCRSGSARRRRRAQDWCHCQHAGLQPIYCWYACAMPLVIA